MLPEDKQTIRSQLFALIERYCHTVEQETGELAYAEYDEQWLSPAQRGDADGEKVYWFPVEQHDEVDFEGVENALDIILPQAGKLYWSSYFSGSIGVTIDRLAFELLLPWNTQDIARFQENVIGHLLLQRQRKIPPTMFIGCGLQDDRILSIDWQGHVVWEWPGRKKQVVLATDLGQLLQRCEPLVLPQ